MFAKPEMGSVRFRVHKIRRRPWPSAARVRPASVPARTPRGTRTPTMTGRRVAWLGLPSPLALTRRTPMKRSTLRLRGGRRTPLVAYAPSLSCAPPMRSTHHWADSISSFLPQMNANELNNTRLRCAFDQLEAQSLLVHGLQRPRTQDFADFECIPDNTSRGGFILIDFP